MDRKKLVLLLAALVIAAGTAFIARSMFAGASAPEVAAATGPVEPTGPRVLVAQRSLPVGTIITQDAISYQAWPQELVRDAYFIDGEADVSKLLGTVVRYQITAGEPVTQGALVAPGDRGFLAAALAPGMRAVTVPVSAQTSVAGFVFPGDRIDLVLTQSVAGGGEGEPLKVSETILRNLRVLATDQRMDALGPDGKPVVQTYSNVTLEVTPKIAEKIAVAQTVGSLSMSLRSMADTPSDLDAAIAGADVDLPEGASPAAEKAILAKLAARPVDRGSTYSTGADVSRYQRSSVPAKAEAPVPPAMAANGAPVGTVAFKGPTIRVARGTTVTEVPVGGK